MYLCHTWVQATNLEEACQAVELDVSCEPWSSSYTKVINMRGVYYMQEYITCEEYILHARSLLQVNTLLKGL